MTDKRIEEHLQRLNGYIIRLKKYADRNIDEFISDDTIVYAAERNLQLAIETCLNIGNRFISISQFEEQVKIPENYSDIFEQLARLNVIDTHKLNDFINMARFRNRLVHVYWEIDSHLLHKYLNENLSDFEYFFNAVVKHLNKSK